MPTITGIVIPADTEAPISIIEFERGEITAIKDVVDGRFDVIDTSTHGASTWINDEGKLIGLPFNPRATLYLWLDSVWREEDVVLGDVLITGQPDSAGNTTSAPEVLSTLLFHTENYRMEVQTYGSESWNSNSLTFDEPFSAMHYAVNLARRWNLVENIRITPI